MHELPRIAANLPVGKKAGVKILRNGKVQEKTVLIEQMKEVADEGAVVQEKLGLVVTDLNKELAAKLGTKEQTGVIVAEVKPGGAAEEAGVVSGDIIVQVDNTPTPTVTAFKKALEIRKPNSILRLLLLRGGSTIFVAMKTE